MHGTTLPPTYAGIAYSVIKRRGNNTSIFTFVEDDDWTPKKEMERRTADVTGFFVQYVKKFST
jgi:hypothetical protein